LTGYIDEQIVEYKQRRRKEEGKVE